MTQPPASTTAQILTMGTRGSALALAQARRVARQLEAAVPGLQIVERIIRTTGDKQQGVPLPAIGGKGVFTLEIEQALLDGEIDFAIHSLKDLPPQFPAGLCLAMVPARESAADAFIFNPQRYRAGQPLSLDLLPQGAHVGTSSLRRSAQLLALRPDLQVSSVRGNIDTRLRKLEDEGFDAIVLARAGLNRLNLQPACSFDLDETAFVPAPGQGALAIEARTADRRTLTLLDKLNHPPTRYEVTAERAAMEALGAGCSKPFGARAHATGSTLHLHAVVLSPDGTRRVFTQAEGTTDAAEELGRRVTALLLQQGAAGLIAEA